MSTDKRYQQTKELLKHPQKQPPRNDNVKPRSIIEQFINSRIQGSVDSKNYPDNK